MPIEYRSGMILREHLRKQPKAIFVFGDNMRRVGLGGQAKEMRGEPNALGVATLYAPGQPYRNGDLFALEAVLKDLLCVAENLANNRTVIVPVSGIGTGYARLPQAYPALHQMIRSFFAAAAGGLCLWD
jgi:hypothetical protein